MRDNYKKERNEWRGNREFKTNRFSSDNLYKKVKYEK